MQLLPIQTDLLQKSAEIKSISISSKIPFTSTNFPIFTLNVKDPLVKPIAPIVILLIGIVTKLSLAIISIPLM